MKGLRLAAAAGGVCFLVGLLVDPQRAWGGFLIGFLYFVGLALAGPLLLSITYLADARWALPLRRVPEALGALLPVGLVLGIVLLGGTHALYEWSHAEAIATDALLAHKAGWLNVPAFSLRMLLYFVLWIWLARRLAARSRARDESPLRERRDIGASALFMALFAISFCLASVDWVQSLEPHWFSTIFPLRLLSGIGCAGVALCALVLVALRRSGLLREVVTRDLLDDLGKILLGLSVLWAYVWYCQYMIIWYANLPEETGYYLLRRSNGWLSLWRLNLLVNFAVPFLFLMLRSFRRNPVVLARLAGWILLGHALDLYVLVGPPLMQAGPKLGAWELGPGIGALALFAWLFLRRLSGEPLLPEQHGPAQQGSVTKVAMSSAAGSCQRF